MERGPNAHVGADGYPKVGYPTRKVARKIARRVWSARSVELFAYRCGECPGWHLTHSMRRSEP